MSTQHTPLPWAARCYLRPDLDDDPMGVYIVEMAADVLTPRYHAAEPDTEELDAVHAENEANAEFIERAVNSYDDLLTALRFERQIQEGNDAEAYPQFIAMRDAAIAKAEED